MSERPDTDTGEPWSDAAIRDLRRCIALGEPPNEIASYLSRPKQDIRDKALELELRLPWDDDDDRELTAGLEAGRALQDIADMLTRTKEDVVRRLRGLGFPDRFFHDE